MKAKKYLHVLVKRNNGTSFFNHLKLSEVHFISQLAQENKELVVSIELCDEARYKYLFG